MGKLYVAGLGPGAKEQMTGEVRRVLKMCPVIVGYTTYLDLIREEFPGKKFLSTPMRQEKKRCQMALQEAREGGPVAMVCSGDPGVYGMAGLLYEMSEEYPEVEIEVLPGVTAAVGGAAVLGAPLSHDFAVISLSDLLTPWEEIQKRLHSAARADFVICLYNPSSKKRADHLRRACRIIGEYRTPDTVCGLVRNIGREQEEYRLLRLEELKDAQTDMLTTVFVGNSKTREIGGKMVTPRGYEQKKETPSFDRQNVILAGIGPGSASLLSKEAESAIQKSSCVIGARRMVESVRCMGLLGGEKPVFVSYDPEEIHALIRRHPEWKTVLVALSGDSGFYSGAKGLLEELAEYSVTVIPGISSVACLAAKLGTSWEDAAFVSIHGRKHNYIQCIATREKTFLLLGDGGEEICEKIRRYGLGETIFFIGKHLSYDTEEIVVRFGRELTPEDFKGLCTAMVENPFPRNLVQECAGDEAWMRGKVPMTKEEVRSVSLQKLRLTADGVLYDIGAGTGSVGIQAAVQRENLEVYAVEKNPEGIALIEANKTRFCTDYVQVIHGEAPDVLEELKPPTHVFIGGSAGRLKEIIACVRRKNPKVRIVLNAVSLETVSAAMEAAREGLLLSPEVVQVHVARTKELGGYHMLSGLNPVYIISDGGEDI